MNLWFWRKPSYIILPIELDDLPALAEIHRASFPHGWRADELDRMLDSGGMIGLVAHREADRRVLGFALVRSSGGEAEIITIATAPSARRRGVGRALMEAVTRRLQHDRVSRLFLEVSEENAGALRLYRSLGFRQVGRRQGYYTSHAAGRPATETGTEGTPPGALVMELELR